MQLRSNDETVRITVLLERGSQPPCGLIEDSEGRRTEFAGMLELICLLEVAAFRPEPGQGSTRARRAG